MIALKEYLCEAQQFLEKHQVAQSRRQAEEVIADALEMRRIDLYLQFDRPLTSAEYLECQKRISRRALGEPLQYIAGSVNFLGCSLRVNRDVLIPRVETEVLTAQICETLAQEDLAGKELWDLCCGSGAIGIAIKKRHPTLKVVLSDVSEEALAVARENAGRNQADVEIVQGDLFAPFSERMTDYLVCNPPYVSLEEYAELEREVRDYEPKLALVAEHAGLAFYERLAEALPIHVKSNGKVWLEIGHNQGEQLLQLFVSPIWKKRRLENDWSQKNRLFFLEKE